MGQVFALPRRYHEVSENQIRQALLEANLQFKTTARSFVVQVCPFCKNTPGKEPTKRSEMDALKIFRDTGHAECFHCGYTGSFFRWTRELGVFDMYVRKYQLKRETKAFTKADQNKVVQDRLHMLQKLPHPATAQLVPNPVEQWFESRGIKPATLEKFSIGARVVPFTDAGEDGKDAVFNHWCAIFPYLDLPNMQGQNEVVRYKVRSVHQKRAMRIEPSGTRTTLFGLQNLDFGVRDVILVEGEMDVLSVWQETGLQCLSLPNGGNGLSGDFLDVLEGFDCFYLFLDQDETGRKAKDFLLEKFGRHRCKVVVAKDGEGRIAKDANEALMLGISISQAIQEASFDPPEGFTVLESMKNQMLDYYADPKIGVRYDDLNQFSNATEGHRRGELWIWTGLTGKGKTTILAQITKDLLTKGQKVCWGSFEIQKEQMVNTIFQQLGGTDYERMFKSAKEKDYSAEMLDAMVKDWEEDAWTKYNSLPLSFITSKHEIEIEQILGVMRYARLAEGVRYFVLDNLQFMFSGNTGDKFDKYEICIKKLREFKDQFDCHVDLVVHPIKVPPAKPLTIDDIGTRSGTTQEADMVIAIQRPDEANNYLEILKNRYNGRLGKFHVEFDDKYRTVKEADINVIRPQHFKNTLPKNPKKQFWQES